ncbi:Gmad2 immunoglobulin-like domain-containing protein [Tumebacillus algifaecis]|nr:Gmad2 immunoglobulin-like domain-containing protein [Tumebacillus algifaecis]
MGKLTNKKAWPIWLGAVVVVGAVAYLSNTYFSKQDEPIGKPVTEQPGEQHQEPKPAQEPAQQPAPPTTPTPEPGTSQTPVPATDAISFAAYSGSGSMNIRDRGYVNDAFQLKSIDWSDASRTLYVFLDMRAFEGVAYFRVKDETGMLLEPESVLQAGEGAPAWSPVQAEIPLVSEYKGKVLLVEFYTKSASDGSRTNPLLLKIKPE